MAREIAAAELSGIFEDPALALIDVREIAEYNLAHIAHSVSLPRARLESQVASLVPWQGTRTVVCDDDGRRAALASKTLEAMGYTDVAILSGGINRWVTEGLATEWGLNVPSKDFGEKVLLQSHIPEIGPDELNARIQRGEPVVIVDSRTPEEHRRACIPGSRSLPGAELGLRIWELIGDSETPIVVHCAGRTRSIVGAGTLRRMGVEKVFALKNGTMGWQLAGLDLETGSQRLELPAPTPDNRRRAEGIARKIALDEGVRYMGAADIESLKARVNLENVYLIDVRTSEEYAEGHIPGFRWVPGGQAVQAADNYIGVRGGIIVFTCDGLVRASMTASWFRQMGYAHVYVLEGGTTAWKQAGRELEVGFEAAAVFGLDEARRRVPSLPPAAAASLLRDNSAAQVIFVGSSDEFTTAHVPGARWLARSWLELRIVEVAPAKQNKLVLVSADSNASAAALAGSSLLELGYEDVAVVAGGMAAWRDAGLPVENGLSGLEQAPDDVLPARRSYAEMLNYLRWEEELGHKYAEEVTERRV